MNEGTIPQSRGGSCVYDAPRFIHSKTAATKPLTIERALKTDMLSTLTAYDANLILNQMGKLM